MNNDANSSSPAEQPVPSDSASDSQFMKQFDEVIGSYAEAATAGRDADAIAAGMRALIMAAEEQAKNPSPDVLLMIEADDLESRGDWGAAESTRRKVLALAESSENPGMIAKAQMDLSRLLRAVGRGDEAWQFACAASVSARRKKCFPLLVTALLNEASCALERKDLAKALAAASEAVQVVEPGKLYDHERARALTNRARCLVAQGDTAAAQLDLAAAWELLQARSGSWMLAGIRWTLAQWWEVKGQLEEWLGNYLSGKEAITTAMELLRQSEGPHALLAMVRMLEKFADVSRAVGDPAAAEQSLSVAKSIRKGLLLPSSYF